MFDHAERVEAEEASDPIQVDAEACEAETKRSCLDESWYASFCLLPVLSTT